MYRMADQEKDRAGVRAFKGIAVLHGVEGPRGRYWICDFAAAKKSSAGIRRRLMHILIKCIVLMLQRLRRARHNKAAKEAGKEKEEMVAKLQRKASGRG